MRNTNAALKLEETRVQRLRNRIILAPQEVCIERARYLTESMRRNWDRHPLERISLALENILRNISVIIREDEIIVGCRTKKLKGAPLFPENKSRWIEGDLDAFDQRQLQRALITEAEKNEMRESILPFWKGRCVEDVMESVMPEDVMEDMDKYMFTMMLEINYGIGHFTMNHEKVLAKGLKGIIAEAAEKFDSLSQDERKSEKGIFYESMIRSMKAAILFANRYSILAREMSAQETDKERAEELREIARVCSRVPENPAQTFHEAVQSVYFIHLIAQIESGGNSISLGRIDQILYPYYMKDKEAGNITAQRAQELLALLFIKTNEIWNVLEEAFMHMQTSGLFSRISASGYAEKHRSRFSKKPSIMPGTVFSCISSMTRPLSRTLSSRDIPLKTPEITASSGVLSRVRPARISAPPSLCSSTV